VDASAGTWSGRRIPIEGLPASEQKWRVHLVAITWLPDALCSIATFEPQIDPGQ